MNLLQNAHINCPYCGEPITILVEASQEEQQYFEDCQVCCKPIDIHVHASENGQCRVEARDENDT